MFFDDPKHPAARPSFSDIPPDIVAKIEECIADTLIGGRALFGGFSAGACFVLNTKNKKKLFAKGAHPGDLSHAVQNIRQEIRTYEQLPAGAAGMPRLIGQVTDDCDDGWTLGVWEHIDAAEKNIDAADAVRALASIHDIQAPDAAFARMDQKNYIEQFFNPDKKWQRVIKEKPVQERVIGLFQSADDGAVWIKNNAKKLFDLQKKIGALSCDLTLIHGDLHTDNILFSKEGTVHVIDWPNACIGPWAFDVFFLGAVLESTEGVLIEDLFDHYANITGRRITPQDSTILAASMAGFFADQASRAVPEKLPRLRWVQKSILLALLRYLARAGMCESIPRMKNQTA